MHDCPAWCALDHSEHAAIQYHEAVLLDVERPEGRVVVVMDGQTYGDDGFGVRLAVDMMLVDVTAQEAKHLAESLWACAHMAHVATAQ